MLGVDRESRLSSGSLDDLTTAAQAGLFLLAQNNDLQVQIGELNDRVGHQAHELELAAAKYDACWRQRCHAMQEVADVLKENHELQRDLRLANAHIVKLEDDVSKLESRVHVAESALNRLMHNNKTNRPPGRPQTKWSEPESTLSVQNWHALPTMAEPGRDPPNQDDSIHEGNEDPFATEPPSSTLSVGSPHGQVDSKLDGSVSLDELYQKSVAALATQTQQMQEMQLEQAEERDLIASMRQTIAQLKQQVSHLEVMSTPPLDKDGATADSFLPDSATFVRDQSTGIVPAVVTTLDTSSTHDLGQANLLVLDKAITLEGMHQLVGQLKAHAPLIWSRSIDSVSSKEPRPVPPSYQVPRQCHAAIACLQDIWPAATEADFMDITDWLHVAFRGTGMHRPLRMRNLSEETAAQVVTTLVPLLQAACHRTVEVTLFDRVHYTTDVVLRC